MCTLSASALSYASPYRGAGRNGYIHTSAPMRSSMGTRAVMAQAPVTTMSSTSAYGIQTTSHNYESKAIANDVAVRGIYTSASAIRGGVTTSDTGNRRGIGPRRSGTPPIPGLCDKCEWEWNPDLDDWECIHCHHTYEGDSGCQCDPCHCDVPLDFNWAAALFMTTLAGAYAVYKKRTSTVQ